MNQADPWSILGLPPGSTVADARAARRSLAKQLHPDVNGGDSARMTLVNRALADIEELGKGRPDAGEHDAVPGGPDEWPERPAADSRHPGADHPQVGATAFDRETFTVASLPAEAFEALFVASCGLGDILVADEPYLLELYLTEPAPCFCQLTLVPEAGGSIVTLDISPPAEAEAPTSESVRDALVAELNRLASH